jgi:hypothetical protein
MTWMPIDWARRVTFEQHPDVPVWLQVSGAALRVVFITCLIVITLRVSMPQNETLWTLYDTPGDLVRVVLGLAVCAWIAVQLFKGPKDARSQRTFLYFGLAAVPFALLCMIAIW